MKRVDSIEKVIEVFNLIIFWPTGFYFLWQACGWQGCAGVFLLLFANNIQHRINSHWPVGYEPKKVKYCDTSLFTGANDGSSKQNAWQSLSAARENAKKSDVIYVKTAKMKENEPVVPGENNSGNPGGN